MSPIELLWTAKNLDDGFTENNEPSTDGNQGDFGLEQCKPHSNTISRTCNKDYEFMDMLLTIPMFINILIGTLTKGLESIRTPRCLFLLAKVLWVEFLRVGPVGGVPVEPFN